MSYEMQEWTLGPLALKFKDVWLCQYLANCEIKFFELKQLFEKTDKRRNRPRKHAEGPGRGLERDHGFLLGDDGEGGGGEGEGPEDGERADEGIGHHPVRRRRRAIASQWERGVACQ